MVVDCGGCCRGIARSDGVNVSLSVSRHRPRWKLRSAGLDPALQIHVGRCFAHGAEGPGGASGEQAFLLELSHGFAERG
jgi:hypothetical protein